MMTEKEFYKLLKERKLFAKFCLHLANAFDSSPKSMRYYVETVKDIRDIDDYINSINSWDKLENIKKSYLIIRYNKQ